MTIKSLTAALALTVSAAVSFAGTSAAHPTSNVVGSSPALTEHAVPRGTAFGERSEEARYAAREAASPEARRYRGGDVIVITASALAVVLVVVLILVLI